MLDRFDGLYRWNSSIARVEITFGSPPTATRPDRLAVIGAIFVPYGGEPSGMTLPSEYGATAAAGFVQLQPSY